MPQVSRPPHIHEGSFGQLVQSLARSIDTMMKAELKAVKVDIKLLIALMLLSEEDGINQRKVGERLNFPEYFTSRNIDAMVKAGFAERRTDPTSRRSYLIYLTDIGRAKAAELPPIIARVNDAVLADLTDVERRQVITLLQKVSPNQKA